MQLSRTKLYDDLSEKEEKLIEEYIPDYENYEKFQAIADCMKNTFNSTKFKENPAEFIRLWVQVGIEHPVTYIDAFARITIGLWYPDMNYRDESAAHPYWEWLSTGQDDPARFEGYILLERKPVKLFEWLSKLNYSLTYENWYQRIPVISMMFSSGLVIWCIVFYMLYMIYYKKYKATYFNSISVSIMVFFIIRTGSSLQICISNCADNSSDACIYSELFTDRSRMSLWEIEMKEEKRILYYDLLNISACISVIILHHNGLAHVFTGDIIWKECLVAEVAFYWAVPIFLMLSGATLLNYREKYSTKIFFRKRILPSRYSVDFLVGSNSYMEKH